ncbi:MAG TPA: GIY-YIG nuclease family protein [bacterium]|nr:GIY-YIG nuclease family protein [bacterium]
MYYTYILFLASSGKLYTGSANNLKQRFQQHKLGKVNSTRAQNPVLIHYEGYVYKSDAQRRERFLKTTEGKRLLRQQIRDILEKLHYRSIEP